MTLADRSGGPRLRALLAAVEVVDFVLPNSHLRRTGAAIVMMATALLGCAVLAAVLGLTGVIIVVLGVSQGPFAWLGNAILWTGVIVGFGGAALVMWRIIRRHPALTTLAGFSEPDDPPGTEMPAIPSPIVPPRDRITAERMRALDSRLSARPAADPAPDASGDGSETRS